MLEQMYLSDLMKMLPSAMCNVFALHHILDSNIFTKTMKMSVLTSQSVIKFYRRTVMAQCKGKGKAVPLQAWSDPEGSRKLRFPNFMTMARNVGKVVSLTHQPPLPPGNALGTHFC